MNNLIILVGKVCDVDVVNNSFVLKVNRTCKEESLEEDYFVCETWKGMYSYLSAYINKDDVILIKGKIVKKANDFVIKVDEFSLIQRTNKKISA